MAPLLPTASNPQVKIRPGLCLQSRPSPSPSVSSIPLKKLLLAGAAFGGSYSSAKRMTLTNVSFFADFMKRRREDVEELKQELYEAIAPLDRGADASTEDQQLVEKIVRKLEAVNKVEEPLKSELLNGKWELLYTTSQSLLQTQRPRFLRPNGKIFQAINVDTLRAQNMETWPFYNQATANLVPLNAKRVAVKFDFFRIAGLIPIKNPGSGRGQIEITYLDDELSRGPYVRSILSEIMARSAAAMPTITTTVTVDEPSSSSRGGTTALVLRLNRRLGDGEGDRNRNKKKVSWKEGTVDNEFMQRKSSKKCCIFHKEKPFDEDTSSDEEDSDACGGHLHGCCSRSGEGSLVRHN